ncbi:Uncharacterized protein FWK35_00024045 [Aphis craccivora]|uniref:Uncharacterized protein n=1 Tax=Aphis craccivora TaxID=307492 RepID=A0A6G0YRX0_APHCR|nr:Uncharacterized protein FWK35_00024045 [Aphis craccivora]
MAVVGPSRHSRVSMSLMQGSTNGPVGNHQQASASQQFFHAQQQSHHAAQSASAHPVDYKPDRPIGYGAFGVVWAVTDPRDGRRVALKKLPNVLSALDILQPPHLDFFQEMYPFYYVIIYRR